MDFFIKVICRKSCEAGERGKRRMREVAGSRSERQPSANGAARHTKPLWSRRKKVLPERRNLIRQEGVLLGKSLGGDSPISFARNPILKGVKQCLAKILSLQWNPIDATKNDLTALGRGVTQAIVFRQPTAPAKEIFVCQPLNLMPSPCPHPFRSNLAWHRFAIIFMRTIKLFFFALLIEVFLLFLFINAIKNGDGSFIGILGRWSACIHAPAFSFVEWMGADSAIKQIIFSAIVTWVALGVFFNIMSAIMKHKVAKRC